MGGRSRFVDLWPADQRGDRRTAFFYVPEKSSRDIVEKAKVFFAERWFTWLMKEGWDAAGPVLFGGPFRAPDPAHLGDWMFLMSCRFRRFKPVVISRETWEGAVALNAKHDELPANKDPGLLRYLTDLPPGEAERSIRNA